MTTPPRQQAVPEKLKPLRSFPLGAEYLLALGAALALYVVSVAPGPLWQDSGMAQVRVLQRDLFGQHGLALSHPLYYLLAFTYQLLPFSSSALKTNLVSATFGAITVANVFLLLRLMGGRWAAAVGSVSVAVAHTFWQHCALAEVYTVSTALLTLELICLARYVQTRRAAWLAGLFLANGLGFSNHLLALLSLMVYGSCVLYLLVRGKLPLRMLPVLALCWLVGASLYLGMIVATVAAGEPWGRTLRSALFGVLYTRNVLNLSVSRRELLNTCLYLALNFPTPAILLAGIALWRRPAAPLTSWKSVLLALLAVHLLWAMRYNVADQYTFFIPSIVLIGVLIGIGAEAVLSRHSRLGLALIAAAVLPALLYVPLPQIARAAGVNMGLRRTVPFRNEYSYFLHPWKTGYRGPQQFAASLRNVLPSGSALLADGTAAAPLQYLELSGDWRPDVQLYPRPSTRKASGRAPTENELLPQLEAGKVYVITPLPAYCPDWLLDGYELAPDGDIFRVVGHKRQ